LLVAGERRLHAGRHIRAAARCMSNQRPTSAFPAARPRCMEWSYWRERTGANRPAVAAS
jgi:hypothetical protein